MGDCSSEFGVGISTPYSDTHSLTIASLWNRPREPKLKERGATSLIRSPGTVEDKTGTSKRRRTLQEDNQNQARLEDVSAAGAHEPHSWNSELWLWMLMLYSFLVNWSRKAKRRTGTGTGRMRHLRNIPRRLKNGFREGCTPPNSLKRKNKKSWTRFSTDVVPEGNMNVERNVIWDGRRRSDKFVSEMALTGQSKSLFLLHAWQKWSMTSNEENALRGDRVSAAIARWCYLTVSLSFSKY